MWLNVSCLLKDARGNINPICAGVSVTDARNLSSLAPIVGFSLLEPFTSKMGSCSLEMTTIKTARSQPSSPQSKESSANYNIVSAATNVVSAPRKVAPDLRSSRCLTATHASVVSRSLPCS